jgi:serine/threonine protein kinase
MRFILHGTPFELTADDVRERLRNVEPEPVRQLGVRIDGTLYPVKQAFAVATGVPRSQFISQTAKRHLASLGFETTSAGSGTQLRLAAARTLAPMAEATHVSGETEVRPGLAFAGRYQIVRLLGEGGRKRTYLALDTVLDRQVALALVKPGAARRDRTGTVREAATLVQVGGHDNIVTLYDRGVVDRTEYLVFEYLPGGTLQEYLAAHDDRRLAADDVMRLGRQLARALSRVHHRGLIHRDVAPANIWLDERNVAHLGDFDSAISRDAARRPDALPPTTEAYAPPEQVAGHALDERADLYALGAVLYEAATGRRPQRGEKGLKAPRALQPDIPPALNAVIYKLLNQSPELRPPTADIVLGLLRRPDSSLGTSEGFLPWAETLPFPLGSILRHHHAEIDPQVKGEHLLNFFEALAQFTATIELSAYRCDKKFFQANRNLWFGASPATPSPADFNVATFGTWVNLHQCLAKTTHRLLSAGPEDARHCRDLFAAQDQELIDAISSRHLSHLLTAACQIRNQWSHSGVASPQDYTRRLRELEALLAGVQAQLSTAFETWELLKPGPAMYTDGIYEYTVTVLTGTNSAFRKKQTQVGQPLDSAKLYLLNRGNTTALELVPLLRMLAGQKTQEEACYFYNRLVPDGIRWISYHFHAEPEIVLADERVSRFLSQLQAN